MNRKNKLDVPALLQLPAGLHATGWAPSLCVWITRPGHGDYCFREGSRRVRLGQIGVMTQREAMKAADILRGQVAQGVSPWAAQKAQREAAKAPPPEAPPTFADAAALFRKVKGKNWRPATVSAWAHYVDQIMLQQFGAMPFAAVTKVKVIALLEGYQDRNMVPTAERVRSFGERIWDYGAASDWVVESTANPWSKKRLDAVLAERPPVRHRAALPWQQLPGLFAKLAELDAEAACGAADARKNVDAPRCLQFVLLLALRPAEAVNLDWCEIDIAARLWTMPAARDKEGHDRVFPLTDAALACLGAPGEGRVWDATKNTLLKLIQRECGDPAATVHGTARRSFKTYMTDETSFERETIEHCLGHQVGDRAERVYYSGSQLAKRRLAMDAWSRFLLGEIGANVVLLRA